MDATEETTERMREMLEPGDPFKGLLIAIVVSVIVWILLIIICI